MTAEKTKEKEWDGFVYPASHPVANKKGAVVEKVKHPSTGREAVIRLDKKSFWFWTIVGDEFFQSKSGDETRRWAIHFLGKGEIVEWQPVIEVHASSDRFGWRNAKTQGEVSIDIERYWIAKTASGFWRQLEWAKGDPKSTVAVAPEDRMAESVDFKEGNFDRSSTYGDKSRKAFSLPYKSYDRYYLPYDQGVWNGLMGLIKTVNSVKDALEATLQTKEGLAAIAGGTVTTLMLTAGKKKVTEPEDVDFEIEDDE